MAFDRDQMKEKAAALAARGVYVGTSSWKYEGWFGQLYTPTRYEYRGKVAKTRFERDCLTRLHVIRFDSTQQLRLLRVKRFVGSGVLCGCGFPGAS